MSEPGGAGGAGPALDEASLRASPSVRTWFAGLREQSGVDPEEDPERLRILAAFCREVGRSPDEIIRECLRTKGGQTRISSRGRRYYAERIAAFQASIPGDRREQARWGNTIRSFLIHNGILLQSGVQLG